MSRRLSVEHGFTCLQNVGKEPVRLAPCIQHGIINRISKNVLDRREQGVRNGRVMLWLNVRRDVARSDAFDRGFQRLKLVGVLCEGKDGSRKPLRLLARFLSRHIE